MDVVCVRVPRTHRTPYARARAGRPLRPALAWPKVLVREIDPLFGQTISAVAWHDDLASRCLWALEEALLVRS
jgi:hypothetical protein